MNGGEILVTVEILDALRESIVSGEAHGRSGCKKEREFPGLTEEFDKYKDLLIKTPYKPRSDIKSNQVFEKKFFIDKETYQYEIFWDIDKADQMVKLRQPQPFPIQLLTTEIIENQTTLKNYKGGKIDYSKPVYTVLYAPLSRPILIDGNHRALKAMNDGQQFIPSHFIANGDEIAIIADPHSLLMYKIHFNFGKILAYTSGLINKIRYSKSFDQNSFFDIG